MTTRFLVLGPVSVTDGRRVVALRAAKPTALLAAVLLHPGAVVSTDYLRQALWGADQPACAKDTLQTYVLRLKRQFAGLGVPRDTIEAVRGGYRMALDADSLDLVAFRQLINEARRQSDPRAELGLVRRALAMWRGPLLGNVRSDLLQRDVVPRLTEERLRVAARAFELEIALGRGRRVLAELRRATRAHPQHERFWEQLVQALHRTGRRSEALVECRRATTCLRDELGVAPGPVLRRMELAILRGEDAGIARAG
jgi:SARP family transcriptional regulator, regulator of embCAB operon